MNKNEEISEDFINNFVNSYDKNYRLHFEQYIKENKKLTHLCQYECYNKIKKLLDGEVCSRKCFEPLLFSKRDISTIIEGVKENFHKCRFNASQQNAVNVRNKLVKECMLDYDLKMKEKKDEIEYIYKGYLKNLEEFTDTELNKLNKL